MTDEPYQYETVSPEMYLTMRAIAMPKDTNPNGDIFGGWLVSQMDLAASSVATHRSGGRTATVAINSLTFHKPVFVGDDVSCYTEIEKIGNTSITIRVEAWVRRAKTRQMIKVTQGTFVFVAIDQDNKPRHIPKRASHDRSCEIPPKKLS